MEKEISIKLENVNKTFNISNNENQTLRYKLLNFYKRNTIRKFQALKNINIEIYKGETIGVIGRNGSGKTTLTKLMSGAYSPDKGGLISKYGSSLLLNLGVGFSHELTARDNIYVNGSTLGLKMKQIDEIFNDIIAFAELEDFIDVKIKKYSSGMIQRLSFSIALYANADIIFLDEVFAVGDAIFQQKATKVLEENWLKGRTAIIVSHSNGLIQKYCNRTILLENGKMIYFGDTETAVSMYEGK